MSDLLKSVKDRVEAAQLRALKPTAPRTELAELWRAIDELRAHLEALPHAVSLDLDKEFSPIEPSPRSDKGSGE